jgi:hypothetical protein
MATLYFKVSADVDKVIQMRQEVEKLKATIGGMDVNKQGKDVSALMARIRELEGSLAGTARAAAQAGATLEQNFKKRIYDSSVAVNDFTQKIIEQKSVVHETEANVRRLADAYQQSLKKGLPNTRIGDDLKAAKAALAEDKAALFALQQEQAKARLSTKALRDEFALYKQQGDVVVGTNWNIVKSLAQFTGVSFGVASIKNFASAVINTRAEMQMLQAAFETLRYSR